MAMSNACRQWLLGMLAALENRRELARRTRRWLMMARCDEAISELGRLARAAHYPPA